MESIFVRYRNLLVLLLVLLVQILGLAMQVRRASGGRSMFDPELDPHDGSSVRLIRLWANAVVSPFERGIHGSSQGLRWLWSNYFYLRDVRQQNQDLQKTV